MGRIYRKILNTIIRLVNGEPIRVVNTYDALSRVVEVLHPNEHISTYKYDMLGNIIETKTPDAGTVTAEYTPQGQILSRTTANGEVVSYNYDFERLKSVAYSLHPNDSIVYTYGDTLAENFQKGRLLSVTYPMGSEEYTYGNMGEVVKTVKSIVIDEQIDKIHSYTSEFEYDSWNRIQKMIYPDGEVVDYEYYTNGELKAITGEKDGITYPYLVETGYNANGQTAYRILGNGSEQRYFYDKKDRLQTSTLHIGSERISVNTYNYDKVDNITSIHDNSIYFQNYTYDELNRLVSANGYDFGAIGETPNSYNMTMEYNKMSSPITFNQSISIEKVINFTNNTYLYNQESQLNAPIQIGDMRNTINKFKFVSIICLLSLFATSCNKPYKTVYYDTGEKQIEYYTAENNNILVKCYYKNGQMSLIGTMDSEGNYIGECTEYYADGLVKYHGKLQSGVSSYIYEYNPSIDYTKYIKGIELYGNIINATDTITYVLCRNEIIPIRFLTDSIYPEMFLPLFSIEKGTDLYNLPQNSLDKDTYPYMIVTDSLLFNSITIYCLFKDENRKPSFSQPYLKWHFKIEDCND